MKLRHWLLRQIAETGLIEFKYDYFTDAGKESHDYRQEEFRKLEAGEDITPPWLPKEGPVVYMPRCGYDIWRPFWERLSDREKRDYFEKYKAPPDGSYQHLVLFRSLETQDKYEWIEEQKVKLEAGEEIEPPWVTFTISLPDVGWYCNFLERWKITIWIPFWEGLNDEQRAVYLEKWQPPNDEWRANITEKWYGKISKGEEWFEKQKFLSEGLYYDEESIYFPWLTFPKIKSKRTSWDEQFIERWMREIWLPCWNKMSGEAQDARLEYMRLSEEDYQRIAQYPIRNLDKFQEKIQE